MDWNIFFALNFWNRRSRRVAGLQFKYKGNIFWVTIFGIAGIAESQDCRFCINELKYIFLLLIFGIAGVAESQDSWFNINEIFFWVAIFGIAGVAESQDHSFNIKKYFFGQQFLESQESQSRRIADSVWMNSNIFFSNNFWNHRSRRVAGSQDRTIASGPTQSNPIQSR